MNVGDTGLCEPWLSRTGEACRAAEPQLSGEQAGGSVCWQGTEVGQQIPGCQGEPTADSKFSGCGMVSPARELLCGCRQVTPRWVPEERLLAVQPKAQSRMDVGRASRVKEGWRHRCKSSWVYLGEVQRSKEGGKQE